MIIEYFISSFIPRVNFTENLKNKKSKSTLQKLDIDATAETCEIDDESIEKLKKCKNLSVKLDRVKSDGLKSKKGGECAHNNSASITTHEKTVPLRRSNREKNVNDKTVKCAAPVEKAKNKIDIITPIH